MTKQLSEIFKGRQFCLLTTFKKDGSAVPTPMWFFIKNEKMYMTTRGQSWKVKRIRRTSEVKIASCNSSGGQCGRPFSAQATLVEETTERDAAKAGLNHKYGLKKKIIDLVFRLAAKDKTEAILKISLNQDQAKET